MPHFWVIEMNKRSMKNKAIGCCISQFRVSKAFWKNAARLFFLSESHSLFQTPGWINKLRFFFENSHLTCSYQYHITHTKKKLNCDCPPIWDHLNYFCWAEVYRRFNKKFWITLILLNSRPLVNFLDFQRVVWAIALLDCNKCNVRNCW